MKGSVRRRRSSETACPCPLCLEHVVAKQGFALPCCNRHLAKGVRRQRIHKTCFFSYARNTFEEQVDLGDSLLLLPDSQLRTKLRCPRCREELPVERRFHVRDGGVLAADFLLNKTVFARANVDGPPPAQSEDTMFYGTKFGMDGSPGYKLQMAYYTGNFRLADGCSRAGGLPILGLDEL